MNKKIYCIVGKSGSGKDTVARILEEEYGYRTVKSFTTRKKRYEEEDTHIFIDQKDFSKVISDTLVNNDVKMVAYTFFDGNHYFATKNQVLESDIYIIDQMGIQILRQLLAKEVDVKVIYITCPTKMLYQRMRGRGEDDESIQKRIINDEELFDHTYLCEQADLIVFSDLHPPVELAKTINDFIKETCEARK